MSLKILISLCTFPIFVLSAHAQDTDAFRKIKPVSERYQTIPLGDILPQGWLLQQLEENLDGFTGHLDSLVPDLVVKDEIYGKDRLTTKVKSKDVGALASEGDWQVQFLWWNSETQSNWWDGYIRTSILTGNERHLQKIKKYIKYILSTQDADGYLGIYDPELRYHFNNENGELWSKTTLLRGLLAWYEYSKDQKVLAVVERAVQDVMTHYPAQNSHPFYSVKPDVGGLSHGLTFTDVLEQLNHLTGKKEYLDYALFCYADFSRQVLNEDAQFQKLIQRDLLLKGHGVHAYEHIRSVAAAYYASGNPLLFEALKNYLYKIELETVPSGAPVGDEWVGGREADATNRGYEYCSLHELLHSYASLLVKSGASEYGDHIERLFFNAAQGARKHDGSCIAYLKSDNSYQMTGGLNGDTSNKLQTRYKYSPVHQDAAVCCVPNAGRIAPYFIQHMWLKQKDTLVASLLGPCELNTTINGTRVHITENTSYPYSNVVTFEVYGEKSEFTLRIRIPSWADKVNVNTFYKEEDGYVVVRKKWSGRQIVRMEFSPRVAVHQDNRHEYYFTYGPLVLAVPLKATETVTKSYPVKGFHDYYYRTEKKPAYAYDKQTISQQGIGSMFFRTFLYNRDTRKREAVYLEPIGRTILRQVTFPAK
jgi:DUF1680 family protein